jgi:hypothetical protein
MFQLFAFRMALRRGQASLARHGVVTGGASMIYYTFCLAIFIFQFQKPTLGSFK